MTRDWTLTDRADAADAQRSREWWKTDPFAEWNRSESEDGAENDTAETEDDAD